MQEPSYSAAQQVYGGSIMTPATPFTGQQDSHGGDSYDDEPPLMEGKLAFWDFISGLVF